MLRTALPPQLAAPGQNTDHPPKIEVEHLDVYYGRLQALRDVTLTIRARRITALIGPSGCGKSTFLRTLDRMNDIIEGARATGGVLLDGEDLLRPEVDVVALRRRVGMVFQRANPFPMSIYDNIAYGPRLHGLARGSDLEDLVEASLQRAALW